MKYKCCVEFWTEERRGIIIDKQSSLQQSHCWLNFVIPDKIRLNHQIKKRVII